MCGAPHEICLVVRGRGVGRSLIIPVPCVEDRAKHRRRQKTLLFQRPLKLSLGLDISYLAVHNRHDKHETVGVQQQATEHTPSTTMCCRRPATGRARVTQYTNLWTGVGTPLGTRQRISSLPPTGTTSGVDGFGSNDASVRLFRPTAAPQIRYAYLL